MFSCSGGSNGDIARDDARAGCRVSTGGVSWNAAGVVGSPALRCAASPTNRSAPKVPVLELADLTWEEVRDLDRARAVAILPVGAIEAHGPHLPLSTDTVIATAMARAGAERLASAFTTVLLPALSYSAAPFGAGFAGTLSLPAETLSTMFRGLARELTRHGFAALAIANAHLDPTHLRSIDDAVARARTEQLLPVIAPNLTRKPWASRL